MTRALFVSCAVVGAVAIVGAQGNAGRAGGAAPAPGAVPDTYDPSKTQTISGCLKPAATSGQFMVADATVVKGAGAAVGTSGAAKKNYTITGVIPPGVKLQTHVNHKVELAGTILANGNFEMENLKMISATCP